MTIAVILRPSFSVTKRRLGDRLTGTLIGCLLTFAVLTWLESTWLIVAILFVAMVTAPMFLYLRYRYAAMGFSIVVLLQMHLMQPSAHIIRERIVDTIVGGLLATLFSFLLTNWEYLSLPRLVRLVLEANRTYSDASFRLLQGKCRNDFVYRIERKRLMDALAGLSAALVRMLDEPASKQRSVLNINQFIVQNYLLVAHVAALRSLLQRHAKAMPVDAVNQLLMASQAQVGHTLALALRQGEMPPPDDDLVAPAAPPPELSTADAAWSGWPLMQRRIRLLLSDADKITAQSAAIVREAEPV